MTKNYADIYNSANDSSALEQRFYLKKETTRGTMVYPGNSDHFLHLPGGSITFEQPIESSPQRSGRHHSGIIKKKKVSSFNFSTYFNIDTAAVTGKAAVDTAVKALFESLFGREDVSGNPAVYDSATAPNTTFTLMEVGDKWARQTPGAFVMGGNIQLPGDGEATIEWSGNGKTTYLAGIGKSTTSNNGGNDVDLQTGEGARFMVGAAVMLIEANGTTRSADTAAGVPRIITAISGDTVTLSGAVLADADGSSTPIYLVYYEPDAPTAKNNPVTGLVGSVAIAGLDPQITRSLGINIQNNHELIDYAYGQDGLGGTLFIPGDRMTAEITLGMNLNHDVLAFFNGLFAFPANDITAILGDSAGRHFEVLIPNAKFNVPAFTVPDTGSIPVECSGTAYESALGAADEVTASFK